MYLFLGFLICACAAENLAAYSTENSAPKFNNPCKNVDSGYELCAFQNVTGTSLRVDCQLRHRPWATAVTIGFDISDIPNTQPAKRKCLYNETDLGDYVCTLLVDAAYAHTMTLKCFAEYTHTQNKFSQYQDITVFNKTNFESNIHSFNNSVQVRRKNPLLDCKGRTGYMVLGWSLNLKRVIVNGSLQNTIYVPGDKLEAKCAVGCHTKIPPLQDWTLGWTLDDVIIRNESVSSTKYSVLLLSRNLTEEDNGKTLKCGFISTNTMSGKRETLEMSTKLSVYHQEKYEDVSVSPSEKSESSEVPEDLRFITTAATVGGLVALVLVVATVFFCRRRFRSSVNEKNSDAAEKETVEMYTELSPRGVVYADLNLPSGATFAGPTEICQYAEIIGVVKNETSGNVEGIK